MSIYCGDKPVTLYYGDRHPLTRYYNGHKIAGWRWDEQSALDMPFERTYNDRVDVEVLGRSEQVQTEQGKNLFDWETSTLVDIDGNSAPTFGSITDGVYTNQRSFYNAGVHITVPRGTISGGSTYTISFDVIAPMAQPIYFGVRSIGGTRTNTSKTVGDGVLTHMSMTVTAPAGYDYYQYVQLQGSSSTDSLSLNVVFTNIQLEIGTTATPYAPFVPNSPSPDYPSPIVSSAGEVRVEEEFV